MRREQAFFWKSVRSLGSGMGRKGNKPTNFQVSIRNLPGQDMDSAWEQKKPEARKILVSFVAFCHDAFFRLRKARICEQQ